MNFNVCCNLQATTESRMCKQKVIGEYGIIKIESKKENENKLNDKK